MIIPDKSADQVFIEALVDFLYRDSENGREDEVKREKEVTDYKLKGLQEVINNSTLNINLTIKTK